MIIVVNDANILIDLIELELLVPFFALDFEFYTTDLILAELFEEQQQLLQPYIEQQILIVEEINGSGLEKIVEIQMEKPQLSEQDCSAFYQAQKLQATLITSDNNLRGFAQSQNLDVHGHLWVFDKMVESATITLQMASAKLDELCFVVNTKLGLPKKECEKRREDWGI